MAKKRTKPGGNTNRLRAKSAPQKPGTLPTAKRGFGKLRGVPGLKLGGRKKKKLSTEYKRRPNAGNVKALIERNRVSKARNSPAKRGNQRTSTTTRAESGSSK